MDNFKIARDKADKQQGGTGIYNQVARDYLTSAQDEINKIYKTGDTEKLKKYVKYWKVVENLNSLVDKSLINDEKWEATIDKWKEAWLKGLQGLRRQELRNKEHEAVTIGDLIRANLFIRIDGESVYLIPGEDMKANNDDGRCLISLHELKLMGQHNLSQKDLKRVMAIKKTFKDSLYVERKNVRNK